MAEGWRSGRDNGGDPTAEESVATSDATTRQHDGGQGVRAVAVRAVGHWRRHDPRPPGNWESLVLFMSVRVWWYRW